jgi:phosphate:Na+ symporter
MSGNFSNYVGILFSLAGGVGVFLLGMKFLSDGLQTVAGDRLRTLVGMATNNRIMGVGIGLLVTGIIQSSSVTTVLVVSFVDGGLMTLAQAVGVIMGANIGTTITGWILTIKIDEYGIPIAGIAAIVYIFSKRDTAKYIALGVLGLGCVFMGLLFMKNAMAPVKDYPEFVAMFHSFQANSYLGVLKCAAIGCLLTLVVQSSSVTVGITMVLATQGLIGFHTAAALVLGENVGTTITALLASLGANNNARRAALFHSLFNLTGVFYVTILFQPFIHFVEWELLTFFGLSDLEEAKNISFGIAAVHSTFNIFNTLLFLAPCRLVARLLENQAVTKILANVRILRKETPQAQEMETLLTSIYNRNMDSSYIKFIEMETRIRKVLIYMGNQLKIGMRNLSRCIENSEISSPEIAQIFEIENRCDKIKIKLSTVLTGFVGSEETATSTIQQRIFAYERIFDNLESTSDYIAQVAKLRLRILDNKLDFLDYQKDDLLKLNSRISEVFDRLLPALENIQKINPQIIEEHERNFAAIKDIIRSIRVTFWNISSGNVTEPVLDDAYSNILSSYRKIRDHLRSAGNAIFGIDRD